MATLSIRALYKFDPQLFSFMYVPQYITKQTLINRIITDYAELEVLYPDPEVMRDAIAYWSYSQAKKWERMSLVLNEDYDPFINIKRDEVRTITQDRDLESTADGQTGVSAWNSDEFEPRTSQTTSGTDTGRVTTTEHFHVEGDSAITDAQDVLKKEVEIRKKYNMYDIIMNDFKRRFLLEIY